MSHTGPVCYRHTVYMKSALSRLILSDPRWCEEEFTSDADVLSFIQFLCFNAYELLWINNLKKKSPNHFTFCVQPRRRASPLAPAPAQSCPNPRPSAPSPRVALCWWRSAACSCWPSRTRYCHDTLVQ